MATATVVFGVLFLAFLTTAISQPTVTNSTGVYYIASKTGPFSNGITCSSSTCTIICDMSTGCYNIEINATSSTELNLQCSSHGSCYHTSIYCPQNGNCNVVCLSESYSCNAIRFKHETISSMNLYCESAYSCQHLAIDLIVTKSANIFCHGGKSCQNAGSTYMSIVGVADVTNISISAPSSESFKNAQLIVSQVNILDIQCGFHACMDRNFTATDINTINVICAGSLACYNTNWNLQSNNINVFCDEHFSCRYLSITSTITNSISMQSTVVSAYDGADIMANCIGSLNILNCKENITLYCDEFSSFTIAEKDQCNHCLDIEQQRILYNSSIDQWDWQRCEMVYRPGKPVKVNDIIKIVGSGYDYAMKGYDFNFWIGTDRAFYLSARFETSIVVRNSEINGVWQTQESQGGMQLSSNPNDLVSLEFKQTETYWEISYFGNVIPEYSFNHIIHGNITNISSQNILDPHIYIIAQTESPTSSPTYNPTSSPTYNPTPSPTYNPTSSPTFNPTPAPTFNPTTSSPTGAPTIAPTGAPTEYPAISRVFTSWYGGFNGTYGSAIIYNGIKQDKISNISWALSYGCTAYVNDGMITSFKWNGYTYPNGLGSCSINQWISSCSSIILDNDEYINGYRVFYGESINGIHFMSTKNNLYKCGPLPHINYNIDSGWVSYDKYYLSGFEWNVDEILNAIRFQFTAIEDSYNCISSGLSNQSIILDKGTKIYSPNGAITMSIDNNDGHLCLNNMYNYPLWCVASEVNGYDPKWENAYVVLQTKGNIVYQTKSDIIWSTNTFTHTTASICVLDCGKLILSDKNGHKLWETSSIGHTCIDMTSFSSTNDTNDVIIDINETKLINQFEKQYKSKMGVELIVIISSLGLLFIILGGGVLFYNMYLYPKQNIRTQQEQSEQQIDNNIPSQKQDNSLDIGIEKQLPPTPNLNSISRPLPGQMQPIDEMYSNVDQMETNGRNNVCVEMIEGK